MGIQDEELDSALSDILRQREFHVSDSLSIGHGKPLHIVKGRMQYLYSKDGNKYLDLVNNVSHVGHCNPHVVKAGQRQMALLNTNTRYIYKGLTDYLERLSNTLPELIKVGFLVNSGSEANELAIRLARSYTKKNDVVVVDGAYHGNTGMLIDLSPYKFKGQGGKGKPEEWVHVVPTPDKFRNPSTDYSDDFQKAIGNVDSIAAIIIESMLSCAGQIPLPEGYLSEVYEIIRSKGGLCIADEVQVGFGRIGSHMWAFAEQNVVPDIVVMGKPIGNGHPMAAVFTTREIANAFEGMEYFSTFGGNPVSCAIGMAVLDVIEDDNLINHAKLMGDLFIKKLTTLKEEFKLIGDIRGKGLFLGIELIKDHETLEPAPKEAKILIDKLLNRGILLSIDGPHKNVIKIKPPLVITEKDVEFTIDALRESLEEVDNLIT